MNNPLQNEFARAFHALHRTDGGFLLPNAWDATSARLFETAGFEAIGTTSAGIAYARGRRDGQRLTRAEMLRELEVIIAAVRVPVTADVEAGYGDAPEGVARTVRDVIGIGAVGANIEDGTGRAGAPLYPKAEQERRLAAARGAADATGVPFVLNARVDTFLTASPSDAEERYADTVRRGRAYLNVGADVVFVPGVTNAAMIRALASDLGGPLNVMAVPGAPSVPELLKLGVARVSIGQGAMLAAMGTVAAVARELRESGTYGSMTRSFYGFAEAESLFARVR